MIELSKDTLVFRFPEVHERAELRVGFQRTLRIPDDERTYPLPAGLGCFPVRHVDDFASDVPESWIEHGGVMLPMYQSEALWIFFHSFYPMAVKVAAGKIDAITGDVWSNELQRDPQNYVVAPPQPWLDGYNVEKGVIRQFVAMPLGSGYSAEEQITGKAEFGGLQILAHPLKLEVFEAFYRDVKSGFPGAFAGLDAAAAPTLGLNRAVVGMGLAPGGRMRQVIFDDPHKLTDWKLEHSSRCFVHIANSELWRAITREAPPTKPITARDYRKHGIPWFDYYDESSSALPGSKTLSKLKSWATVAREKRDPTPDNEPTVPERIIELRRKLRKDQVREGTF